MKSRSEGIIGIKNVFVTFLIAVSALGLYFGFTQLKNIIGNSPKQVRLYYKKVYRFSEQEQSLFLKNHAGLWQFTIETMAGGKTVKKTDRLEIKENGIVWQVTEWNVTMPSGSLVTFSQVRTAFLKPYGVMRNDSLSDAFILTQIFITGSDTCFGGWNYPELWEFSKNGASLMFNKRQYTSYNGELADFFPSGSVAYVQSAQSQFFKDTVVSVNQVKDTSARINQLYSVRKVDSQTGKVTLVPIRDTLNNLFQLFRNAINREMVTYSGNEVNQDAITAVIDRYFGPFIVSEKLRNFPRDLPDQINASFIVAPDGSVSSIRLTSSAAIDKMLAEDLSKEIGSWRLPFSTVPIKAAYTFKMP